MFCWEDIGIHTHHVYFEVKSETSLEEKSSLIPFTKIYGFHQIIDRFSQPCTVGKTQLLSVYLQLLLADLNGFTSLQYIRSTRTCTSLDMISFFFGMSRFCCLVKWHQSTTKAFSVFLWASVCNLSLESLGHDAGSHDEAESASQSSRRSGGGVSFSNI